MKGEPARVWIASPGALSLEAVLGESAELLILGSGDDASETVHNALGLRPDVLLLSDTLRGADGYWVLDQLRESAVCPPRVLFLCAAHEGAWQALAIEKGADAAVAADCGGPALIEAALRTARLPLPRLAQETEALRLEIAEQLIGELGVRETLRGRQDMVFACAALACAPKLGRGLSTGLYPCAAALRKTTPQAVEKAVRAAVEDTWLRGDLNAIQRLFGMSVDAERGKPTNAEFLAMIAEHVRREAGKRMRNQWKEGIGDRLIVLSRNDSIL